MPRVSDAYPSKFFTAADLHGRAQTFTIDFVELGEVGQGADAKTQILVSFQEASKALGLNKTNASAIAGIYGDDTDDWIGEQVVLFPTRVDFQGKMVDAVRVDERQTRVLLQDRLRAEKAASGKKKADAPAGRVKPMTQAEIDAEEAGEDADIPF